MVFTPNYLVPITIFLLLGLSTNILGIKPIKMDVLTTKSGQTKGMEAMLTTGNQLRAARSLLDLEQGALATLAGVSVNTIRNLEGSKGEPIRGHNQTVVAVQTALESAGIEFLNHGQPGVRLRAKT